LLMAIVVGYCWWLLLLIVWLLLMAIVDGYCCWLLFGYCLAIVWLLLMAIVVGYCCWLLFGYCLAIVWLLLMAIVWLLFDYCLAIVWLLFGYCLSKAGFSKMFILWGEFSHHTLIYHSIQKSQYRKLIHNVTWEWLQRVSISYTRHPISTFKYKFTFTNIISRSL
jgi:hypothetical protein